MGLSRILWRLMLDNLPRGRLLSFGCPDPLFPADNVTPSKFGEEIRRTHKLTTNYDFPDPVELFRVNGWSLVAVDVMPSRGIERVIDLNSPLPANMVGQFDAVLDAGTAEHVFNIGSVFVSALSALRIGGAVLHENPLVFGNHGFWSVQPTAPLDFYGQNGCEVKAWICEDQDLREIDTKRFAVTSDKSTTISIAKKIERCEIRWPTQARYL